MRDIVHLSAKQIADLQRDLQQTLADLDVILDAYKCGVIEVVRCLAREHQVVYEKTDLDELADTFTHLSGDDIVLDEIEELIIELARRQIISKDVMIALQVHYLRGLMPPV